MLNFDSERLSHAYIAAGHMVNTIAATAVCSNRSKTGPCNICKHCLKASRNIHPDIISLSKPPDKKDFPIDQIRELKRDVIITPNEADMKVYIINDAHLMNIPAQNAFLKILEEPPKHVVFILNTCFPVKLLKTTLSRCVLIKTDEPFESEPSSKTDYDDNDYTGLTIEFFTAIEKGNQAIVELMFKLDKMTKAQFYDFISSVRNEIVKKLRSPYINEKNITNKNLVSADTLLVKAYDFLDQNVNVGHISGYICANLLKTGEN